MEDLSIESEFSINLMGASVFHAKQTLQEYGQKLSIESDLNQGTNLSFRFSFKDLKPKSEHNDDSSLIVS